MNQTKNFSGLVSLMLAVLIGALPFAAPEACAQALREGLTLCSGPLPALAVSVSCGVGTAHPVPSGGCAGPAISAGGMAGGSVCSLRGPGAAGGIPGRLCPAANASAEAVRSGQMTPEEADRLLPALRLFRTVLCHPDGGTDPAGQHRGGRFAVSGTDHGQLPLCGSAFPTGAGQTETKKGDRRARNSRKCRSCAWMAFWRSPR